MRTADLANRINELLEGHDPRVCIRAIEIVLSQSIGLGEPDERREVQNTITRLQAELNGDLPHWPSIIRRWGDPK
jgi:hypothetical protein